MVADAQGATRGDDVAIGLLLNLLIWLMYDALWLIVVVLQSIAFVNGSELESHVHISLILSELIKGGFVIVKNGMVVVI